MVLEEVEYGVGQHDIGDQAVSFRELRVGTGRVDGFLVGRGVGHGGGKLVAHWCTLKIKKENFAIFNTYCTNYYKIGKKFMK